MIDSYEVRAEVDFGAADVNSLCFDSTGGLLAVCTSDKKINVLGITSDGSSFKELPISPLNAKGEYHTYSVSCCCFCCHSALFATCGIDGYLIVWDFIDVTNPVIHQKFKADQFKICRFSTNPNIKLLAAGDADGLVYLYDYGKKCLKHKLKGHQGQITGLAFSPDSFWLVAGSSGMGTGDLWLWSVNQPSQLENVSSAHAHEVDSCAHEMGIYCIHFSPTFSGGDSLNPAGLLLATGGGDNCVKLWTVRTMAPQNSRIKLRAKLEYHTYMVTDCQFSLDGCFLCTVSLDKNVCIWSSSTAELLQVLNKHVRFISCCSWNPHGGNRANRNARVLATGGNDKRVVLWNIHVRGEQSKLSSYHSPSSQNGDLISFDDRPGEQQGGGVSGSDQQPQFPDEFYCPISHEIMKDPVVAVDGYTYERKSLKEWFTTSHTSPITNLPLPSLQLIPNRTLKSLITTQTEKDTK